MHRHEPLQTVTRVCGSYCMTFAFPAYMLFPFHESRDTGSTGVSDVICVFHGLSLHTYTKKKTYSRWRGDGDVVVWWCGGGILV